MLYWFFCSTLLDRLICISAKRAALKKRAIVCRKEKVLSLIICALRILEIERKETGENGEEFEVFPRI